MIDVEKTQLEDSWSVLKISKVSRPMPLTFASVRRTAAKYFLRGCKLGVSISGLLIIPAIITSSYFTCSILIAIVSAYFGLFFMICSTASALLGLRNLPREVALCETQVAVTRKGRAETTMIPLNQISLRMGTTLEDRERAFEPPVSTLLLCVSPSVWIRRQYAGVADSDVEIESWKQIAQELGIPFIPDPFGQMKRALVGVYIAGTSVALLIRLLL
jgi:hypothetical protein